MNWLLFIVSNHGFFVVAILSIGVLAAIIAKKIFGFGRFGYILTGILVIIALGCVSANFLISYWSAPKDMPALPDNARDQIDSSVSQESIALYNESNIHSRNNEPDKALIAIDKAIEIDPQYAAAYVKRAHLYTGKGLKEKAISDYDKAISIKPNYAAAYYWRAVHFTIIDNQLDQAIEDFTKAIEFDPNYHLAYFWRAVLYKRKGQHNLANIDSQKGVDLYPDKATAYMDRGSVCLMLGEKDDAINAFSKSIEIAPNRPWGYLDRGKIFLELGKNEQAISNYKAAAKLGSLEAQAFLKSKGISW